MLLDSKTLVCTRRQEGYSLPNGSSAKISSSNQTYSLWSVEEAAVRQAASPGCGSSLVLQECWCFSSVSVNAGEGRLCVKVCKTLEEAEALLFASCSSLKSRLTWA